MKHDQEPQPAPPAGGGEEPGSALPLDPSSGQASPRESQPGAEAAAEPEGGAARGAPSVPGAELSAEALRDRWLRAEAELQNLRRRAGRESEEARRLAEEAVLFEMLAVADDLERALRSVPPGTEGAAWGEGVALVVRRIRDYLCRQGVEAVDPLGMPFDPELHEALLEVDAGPRGLPGTVTEVVMKGYRRGNRALRAARVVVAREPQQFRDPEAGHQEATDGEG